MPEDIERITPRIKKTITGSGALQCLPMPLYSLLRGMLSMFNIFVMIY